MAKPRMDLSAFVDKLLEEQDGDVLREGIRVLAQALMETEVAGLIGADRHERTPDRTGHRNGYRMRTWDTRVGTIELAIPKVRPGTYFPSLLQPRRRAEHALLAVVTKKKAGRLFLASGLEKIPGNDLLSHACPPELASERRRPRRAKRRRLGQHCRAQRAKGRGNYGSLPHKRKSPMLVFKHRA